MEPVIRVSEGYRVQLACHLENPPAPVLNGVEKWDWPVFEGLNRFSELVDSPNHRFNFCGGVAGEGLENPAKELPPIVKYFAERKKFSMSTFATFAGDFTISPRLGI